MTPKVSPIKIEKKPREQKSPKISSGEIQVKAFPSDENLSTVLKRMIATASLTMPSPKRREKSVGYSSYLTIEMAAMTSVEQRSDDISRISLVLSSSGTHVFVELSHMVIQP